MGILGRRIAFVFPGQGSQEVGMGRDLAERYASARSIFERADAALPAAISDICFNGPEDELRRTVNTQPALYTVSAAACEAAKERGLQPVMTAGHSVGEYAALYAAGAFSFEEGLKLVAARAKLMDEAAASNPGAMAAILGLAPERVREAVEQAAESGVVSAANFNSPIQTVISGESAAVSRASEIAVELGAKRAVALNVSGAFHSPLMAGAAEALAGALAAAEITDAAIQVVANYTAQVERSARDIRENLAKQLTGCVLWVDSVRRMLDGGVEVFLELGPGTVLAGLVKRIAPDVEVYSVGDGASLERVLE